MWFAYLLTEIKPDVLQLESRTSATITSNSICRTLIVKKIDNAVDFFRLSIPICRHL